MENSVFRLGVLPGTFNPVTNAHLALGTAALGVCDEVRFVLPRALPHKQFNGVGFEDRLRLLEQAVASHPRFSAGTSTGGLFLEIARELRAIYGDEVEISFLCGRDAAERIVGWEYERPEMLDEMFREFSLLVARRDGEYVAPAHLASRIGCLDLDLAWDGVSATEVRERIASGREWRSLVPKAIAKEVEQLYRKGS